MVPDADHRPSAHRLLRFGRHRHHRRDLRQFDPFAVRDQAAPRAPAVHRYARQGAPGGARGQPHGADGRPAAGRLHHACRPRDPRHPEDAGAWLGDGHVQHLHRAARGRVRHHLQSPRRPLRRCVEQPGIHRPHRVDQLRARARRRAVVEESGRCRRDPGRREPQRQDADLALPRHAARRESGQLPAHPGRLRATQAAASPEAVSQEVLRPDHRSRAPVTHSQRAAPQKQIRVARELPLRSERGRSDDAA